MTDDAMMMRRVWLVSKHDNRIALIEQFAVRATADSGSGAGDRRSDVTKRRATIKPHRAPFMCTIPTDSAVIK